MLAKAGLPHTEQHITTMARLHQENCYDRATDDVERRRQDGSLVPRPERADYRGETG